MNNFLKKHIEQTLNTKITDTKHLSGGMISQVAMISCNNRSPLVVKYGDDSHDLTIESYMLTYLKTHSNLPIPKVIHAESNLLIIDYVDSQTGLNATTEKALGKLLAELHQVTNPQYGLERNTLIGPIHQPNPLSDSWIEFFRDSRLLYMADIALNSTYLPRPMYDRIQKLATQLDQFLVEPENPVLIHGDMWTTNILIRDNEIVAIIDPALYYGHNEMELAYMTLFGSVSQNFFDSYTQVISVEADFFDTRRHIYNLYPLLVHVTIFGTQYTSYIQTTLKRFGF